MFINHLSNESSALFIMTSEDLKKLVGFYASRD
jgi:hypothetical protein